MKPVFPKVAAWKVRVVFYGGFSAALSSFVACATVMPGRYARSSEAGDARLAHALRDDVDALVGIGPRNFGNPRGYERAGELLQRRLAEAAARSVHAEAVPTHQGTAFNYFAQWGKPEILPIVIVGAHYDTASDTPGGNDNGTGVAVLLHLAERFRERPPENKALRLILFANEEPPYFWSEEMGSLVHARACKKAGENVVAMLSLETMGHFSDAPRSQEYPFPFGFFYPSRGNFIAFVGNVRSRSLVARSVRTFRDTVQFPSEGGALPSGLPGVGWSDHWSFWQENYPALMVTDTAPFHDANYHEASDTGEQIDFGKLSVIARGVEAVVRELTEG